MKYLDNIIDQIKEGKTQKTIWVDIDGTLCDTTDKGYADSIPDESMICLINYLYDLGHQIILVTARGSTSGINWRSLTEKELKLWGVKYHELIMGKPKDLIIDDCSIRPNEFLEVI